MPAKVSMTGEMREELGSDNLGKPSLGDASPGLPVWREQDRALYEIKARPLFLCPHVPA